MASRFVTFTLYPNFRVGGRVEKRLTGIYLLKKFVTNFDLAVELLCGIFSLESYLVQLLMKLLFADT
jgi:hypothetical protein